jgi:hypothetical protein
MNREVATRVMEFNRLKMAVSKYLLGHFWASELWRLHHMGEITSIQKQAGDDWAKLVFRHRKYNISGEGDENQASRAATDFDRAFCALVERREGVRVGKLVNDLCLEDKYLQPVELILAREGLEALASHFYGHNTKAATCEQCGSKMNRPRRGPMPRFCSPKCQKYSIRQVSKTSDKHR